jgi:hypothetical protein
MDGMGWTGWTGWTGEVLSFGGAGSKAVLIDEALDSTGTEEEIAERGELRATKRPFSKLIPDFC